MKRYIYSLLILATAILSTCYANSVDDDDKKENKSAFPVDGTLITVTEDNF